MNFRTSKAKVLLYGFVYPVLIVIALILLGSVLRITTPKILSASGLIGLLGVTLFKRYFSEDKYLLDIEVKNDRLVLTYLNALAETNRIFILAKNIIEVDHQRKGFLTRHFTTFTVTSQKRSITFNVFEADVARFQDALAFFSATQLNN